MKIFRKGTALTSADVRTTLTDYVKGRNLNSSSVKGAVTLDPVLAKILGKQEQVYFTHFFVTKSMLLPSQFKTMIKM